MAAVDRLREEIAAIAAIDHHAHLLLAPGARTRLIDVLTESGDPVQVEQVRELPASHRALHDLGEVLGGIAPGEVEAVCAAARASDPAAHARRLLGACGFAAMYVDDGYRVDGMVSLDEHAALVRCAVRRVLRIETEAEAASAGRPSFEECRDTFRNAVANAVAAGAVALKTIAAYRCGLDLPAPDPAQAGAAYDAWRRSGDRRLRAAELISVFVADALEAAGPGVPLQVHTGLGDADAHLLAADPALLQAHIDGGMLAGVPVVLLHCYPYVRNAGYLASLYANVHFDLSLAITLMPHRGADLIGEALELAPATKLLFATDASRLPEAFFLGARWWREALAAALGRLVDDGFADDARALRHAEMILAGNARRLYRDPASPPRITGAGSAAAT